MSLILEALRKLERDKDAPERGFLVTAHVPWARSSPRSRLVGVAVLALALAVALLAAVLWRGRGAPAPPAEVAAGTPAASTPPPASSPAPGLAPTMLASAPAGLPPAARRPAPPPRTDAETSPAPAAEPPVASAAPASTAPPAPSPRRAGGPELRLNAISQKDGQPVALLNDRLVREGDLFDGIRILRIGAAEVEVEIGGKRRVVTF